MNNCIIEIANFTVSYKDHKAIQDLSLNIRTGEVCALLGENGAGKSTLVNAILGRIKASSGHIKVFGKTPGAYEAKLRIGTILQSASLPDNTLVQEQLNLFRSYYPAPMDLEQLLKITMLDGLEKRAINTLSGGQKQRVFFALAICGNPDVIFLDEPTVALDTAARREFWRCIAEFKKSGVAIVLTTHYLEEAEALADQIVLLNRGCIRHQGTPAQIKALAADKKMTFRWTDPVLSFSEFMAQLRDATSSQANLSGLLPEKMHCEDDKVTLNCQQPEMLLQAIFNQGHMVEDLCIENARLEEAVLVLSQQQDSSVSTQQKPQMQNGEAA